MEFRDSLGCFVEDRVTGFAGIITGRVEYLSGWAQYLVAPYVGTDGGFRESQWFDCQRCRPRGSASEPLRLDNSKTPGPHTYKAEHKR